MQCICVNFWYIRCSCTLYCICGFIVAHRHTETVLDAGMNTTGVEAYLKEHLVQRVPSRQDLLSYIIATVCPQNGH